MIFILTVKSCDADPLTRGSSTIGLSPPPAGESRFPLEITVLYQKMRINFENALSVCLKNSIFEILKYYM